MAVNVLPADEAKSAPSNSLAKFERSLCGVRGAKGTVKKRKERGRRDERTPQEINF